MIVKPKKVMGKFITGKFNRTDTTLGRYPKTPITYTSKKGRNIVQKQPTQTHISSPKQKCHRKLWGYIDYLYSTFTWWDTFNYNVYVIAARRTGKYENWSNFNIWMHHGMKRTLHEMRIPWTSIPIKKWILNGQKHEPFEGINSWWENFEPIHDWTINDPTGFNIENHKAIVKDTSQQDAIIFSSPLINKLFNNNFEFSVDFTTTTWQYPRHVTSIALTNIDNFNLNNWPDEPTYYISYFDYWRLGSVIIFQRNVHDPPFIRIPQVPNHTTLHIKWIQVNNLTTMKIYINNNLWVNESVIFPNSWPHVNAIMLMKRPDLPFGKFCQIDNLTLKAI